MSRSTLPVRRGQYIRRENGTWLVVRLVNREIQLENINTGVFDRLSWTDFFEGYQEGALEVVDDPNAHLPEERAQLLSVPLADMPSKMRYTAERKAFYVTAVNRPGDFYDVHLPNVAEADRIIPTRKSKPVLTVFLRMVRDVYVHEQEEMVRRRFGGVVPPDFERIPGFSTLCGWLQLDAQVQGDKRGLASRYDRRGPQVRVLSPQVLEWLEEAIDTIWLSTRPRPKSDVWNAVQTKVKEWNAAHPEFPLTAPSQRHVARYIAETVDKGTEILRRKGKDEYKKYFEQYGVGPQGSRIMEILEVDHTRCDIEVLDDKTGIKLGRPWITAALCRYSRMVVGLHIHFEGQTFNAVMQCLRNAVSTKQFLKQWGVDYDYPCYGRPEAFFFDRGPDFRAEAVAEVALTLDIRLDFEPVACPHYKGKIERWWRTLAEKVMHRLPGAAPPIKKGQVSREPDGQAYITYSQLVQQVWYWVAMVYARQYHRGIGETPLSKWMRSDPDFLPRPIRKDKLDQALTRAVFVTPSKDGVKYQELQWTSPDIPILMAHPSYDGEEVCLRFDDADVARAWVVDPFTKQMLPLTPARPAYMSGLSLHQHSLCKLRRREQGMPKSIDSLLAAKAALDEMAAEALESNQNRRKGIAAIARYKRVGHYAPAGEEMGSTTTAILENPIEDQALAWDVTPEEEEDPDDELDMDFEPIPAPAVRQVKRRK